MGATPMAVDEGGGENGRWRAGVVQDFARSELFERTFQEGMELVEETAAYLDGAGRQESKQLDREARRSAYAAESMRLTTRLMQVASWLLVQRAVREGEMEPALACDARYRLARETAAAPPRPTRARGSAAGRPGRSAGTLRAALRAGHAPGPAHVPGRGREPNRRIRCCRSSNACRPLSGPGPRAPIAAEQRLIEHR